jgi:hypothetical protein
MEKPPFDVRFDLDGWVLFWAEVKATPATRRAWLVAYLPSEATTPFEARDVLVRQVSAAPVLRIHRTAAS